MAFRQEAVIKTAEKYVARGRIEAAIKEYRKVLQKNPNDISSLNRVGDLYARINQIDDAVGLFQQIADRYTDDGFFPKAIAIYKKILKLDPRRLESYQSLAELYQKQGLVNDARAQYQVLADYYQKHDETVKAIDVFHRMVELEPDNPSHHVKLADLYRETGLVKEALGEYRTIADLMLAHGHVGEAAQVYHRALDLGAQDLQFVEKSVGALRDAGDVAAAIKLLRAAEELNPQARGLEPRLGLDAPEPTPVRAPSPPPPPPRAPEPPPVAPPEPPPAFDFDESFGSLDDAPTTQVQPPLAAEAPAELEAEAIDIGGGLDLDEGGEEIPIEIDWSEMPALDEGEAEVPELAPSQLEAPVSAPEPEPAPAPRRLEDLLAEAEVFSKYGLAPKALDRLGEALEHYPDAQVVHRLRIGLFIREEDRNAAQAAADRLKALAESSGDASEWETAREQLAAAGYLEAPAEKEVAALEIEAPEPMAELEPPELLPLEPDSELEAEPEAQPEPELELELEPGPEPEEPAPVEELAEEELPALELPELEPLVEAEAAEEIELPEPEPALEPPREAPRDVRAKRPKKGIDAALAEITAAVLRPVRKARPAAEIPAPPPEPPEVPTPAAPPPSAPPPEMEGEVEPELETDSEEVSLAGALDESGMDWLDEVSAGEAEKEGVGEKLFDEEDDFFDLAAELQDELGAEDTLAPIGEPEEQSLEEIVEGFKKGVSEALSEEDVDTHYNLGIAYREMGLIDEAIGEFQLASKDPGYLVNCCAMLGVCFLEKGLPELAVKWYTRALEHPNLQEEEALGLLYDLGVAQLSMGDHAAAHETFVEIYGVNSNYRDVKARMEEAAAAAGS